MIKPNSFSKTERVTAQPLLAALIFSFFTSTCFGFGANTGTAMDIMGKGMATGETGEQTKKNAKKCQQDKQKQPPQPNSENCQKAKKGAGQLAALLPALLQALLANKDTKDSGFSTAGLGYENPAAIEKELVKSGLTAGEARKVTKAKKLLDDLEKSDLLSGVKTSSTSSGSGIASSATGAVEGAAAEAIEQRLKQAIGENSGGQRGTASLFTGGGGGSSGAKAAPAEKSEESEEDAGAEFKLDLKSINANSGLAFDFTTLAGEKIGDRSQNLFDMLSRRYQIHRESNHFISEE